MKEIDRRKPNNKQSKPSGRTERTDRKQHQENGRKKLYAKETESKALIARGDSVNLVSDSNTGTDPSEVYENTVIHYVDDVNRFEEVSKDFKSSAVIGKMDKDENLDDHSSDFEKQPKQGKEEESDSETTKDSVSSQEDSLIVDDEKVEKASRVPESVVNKKPLLNLHQNLLKEVDDKPGEETKETDVLDETSNGAQSIGSDNETVDTEENGEHVDEATLNQKLEAMEMRIEKLEEELRDVAALEISLYSVVPEHGSSAHKVHTPARRLSRLYIHACKHWTQNKRATIAKNTVSGLVLVAKSCGNDVSRLSFWLSNTVVLREIVSQAFGISHHSVPVTRLAGSNGASKKNEVKSMSLKWKRAYGSKQVNGQLQLDEDWQETETFMSALEKVESWIFSRIVESVWWQVLTPYMQSPSLTTNKNTGKLLGPALGDQQQGSFSINLWRNAFQEAHQRLCPVRAGGHECGCLPVLARIVMEQCVARLDVAMFNAILRESALDIPTDPVSDPIVDSKVLPIPAGDLSFGSGAQLKNSVGNWSRWLTDVFGMDSDGSLKDQHSSEDDDRHDGVSEPKSFVLLNDLSDLLMLPKDMLIDQSIRQEVCPSIGLALIKRVLCNFTPDEFCPDPVPGAVLEALNAESIVERRLSGDSARSFPYSAAPVVYTPPSLSDVAEKVAEAGKAPLLRNVSVIQRKGYTSDEELEELDSPLSLILEKLPSSPTITPSGNGNGNHIDNAGYRGSNARYELLREVWSSS
ncbi:hypothetical protein Pint_17979 [Pistacia integerrima]|uniref:Uncharacterized protein n=1 Tax=Pistacia integerrima TaxID=434235 RepID=A0ACC0YU67_9ROSI|nr:hypothetical protein Pint_17979 [Pistacia integerrima]